MMVQRIGKGKGKGRGFKNIIPQDPKTHSDSAKGLKQPQKRPNILPSSADMPVQEIEFDPSVEDKKSGFFSKAGARGLAGIKKSREFASSKIQKLKKEREERKIKELEDIKHPLTMKLEKQTLRVDSLKTQIAETKDTAREEKLFNELEKEQNQLRKIQEDITSLNVQDLSDRELKTLAIRWKDTSIFGSNNPYKEELKRRIKAEKTIEKELQEERAKKPEDSIFSL